MRAMVSLKLTQRIGQGRNQGIVVQTEDAIEQSVFLAGQHKIGSRNHDASLRVICAKVTRKKDLIDGIGGEKNGELDVMLLQLTDDAQHDRFLRMRGLTICKGSHGIIIFSFIPDIRRKRRFARNFGSLRLRGELFFVSRAKKGYFAREVQVQHTVGLARETAVGFWIITCRQGRATLLIRRLGFFPVDQLGLAAVYGVSFAEYCDFFRFVSATKREPGEHLDCVVITLLERSETNVEIGLQKALPESVRALCAGDGSTVCNNV